MQTQTTASRPKKSDRDGSKPPTPGGENCMTNDELDAFIKEAKRLRDFADKSEVGFLQFLMAGEASGVHRRAGVTSFDRLLTRFDICRPERYRDFVASVEAIGIDDVAAVGVEGARMITRIPEGAPSAAKATVDARTAALVQFKDFRARNDVPVSRQEAERLASKHYVPPTRVRDLTPLEEAQAENRRLAARVKDLEARLARVTCESRGYAADLGPARSREISKTVSKKDVDAALASIRGEGRH